MFTFSLFFVNLLTFFIVRPGFYIIFLLRRLIYLLQFLNKRRFVMRFIKQSMLGTLIASRFGKYLYNELHTKIISRFWDKVTTGCFVQESCQARFKLDYFDNNTYEIVTKFFKINMDITFKIVERNSNRSLYEYCSKNKKRNSYPTIRRIGNFRSI